MSGFGARLRRERELRGITLDEISRATKISNRMLEAMEGDDFGKLPGGVFNRGFVRSYARYIGLNEDDAVNDYLESVQRTVEAAPLELNETQAPGPVAGEPARLPFTIVAAIVVVLGIVIGVAVLAVLHRRGGGTSPDQTAPPPGAAAQSQPAEPTVMVTEPSVVINQFQPMPEKGKEGSSPPAVITLELQFLEPTWVSISADDQSQPALVYKAGEKQTFTASTKMDLRVGNAGGFIWSINGKPGVSLGKRGQTGHVVITPETIERFQATGPPDTSTN